MSKTQELLLHDVSIHSARGKDVMHVKVPTHEIAVLRVVHRASNVIDNGRTGEVDDFPVLAADEIGRLQRKYRRINEPDPVRLAFPSLEYDLERAGFRPGQASVTRHSTLKQRPRMAKEPEATSEPQPPGDAFPGAALGDNGNAAGAEDEAAMLRAKLDALGVSYHPRLGLDKLRAAVEQAEATK